ncbi:MFS sugar transporter [Purpureocillium lavendulum]|uniref:MFS sugar transporter n=1 Tax=Purpureocillium lavendulum TaxID=1247861 RepID=A0AB34FUW1_9HYPO|nr:MFS sugar transporter [Purpureocillium lavendulum]
MWRHNFNMADEKPAVPGKAPLSRASASYDSNKAAAAAAPGVNPLDLMTNAEVLADVEGFVTANGLDRHRETSPHGFETLDELPEEDKDVLRYEEGHKWSSAPRMLYLLCALCAGCAIVQGMDQTVINGAQSFYFDEFGITDKLMQGLINGSPYAAAAVIGCWLNAPLNKRWGRRGTIAFSCFLAFATAIWQAVATTWPNLLAARFVLGVAVGAKSATTPVYAAECAPKMIRGALVMMWQMWTAFGIMLGLVVSIAFQHLDFLGPNSQWRWMFGVTAVPPLVVGLLVYCMPESPRWYLEKGQNAKAFESMRRLRKHDIQAARDLYMAHKLFRAAQGDHPKTGPQLFKEFFTVRRNWRAAQINVIAYYSTKIFVDAGYSRENAMLVSFGCGACNFLGAIPAVFTIDKCGRRTLLLVTFPAMALFLFWTGSSFLITDLDTRLASIVASLYCFMILYSPGLGPVPFTYSAEAFPLHIRAVGMSSATSITWAFNFLISFTWPEMMEKFTAAGGFYWYASWNIFGFVFAYFLVPETKNKTLEELDGVFSMRNRDHARYHMRKMQRFWARMLGRDVPPLPPLYDVSAALGRRHPRNHLDVKGQVVDVEAAGRVAEGDPGGAVGQAVAHAAGHAHKRRLARARHGVDGALVDDEVELGGRRRRHGVAAAAQLRRVRHGVAHAHVAERAPLQIAPALRRQRLVVDVEHVEEPAPAQVRRQVACAGAQVQDARRRRVQPVEVRLQHGHEVGRGHEPLELRFVREALVPVALLLKVDGHLGRLWAGDFFVVCVRNYGEWQRRLSE